MRNALPTILTLLTIALRTPSQLISNLNNPILDLPPQHSTTPNPETSHAILQERQYNPILCASGYINCASLGAPGLCCRPNTRCAVDNAGYVACCPFGAVCTGVITALAPTPTTVPQTTVLTTNSGLVLASTGATTTVLGATSTQGFIIAGGTTVVTGVSGGQHVHGMPLLLRYLFAGERTVRNLFRGLVLQ